MFKQGFSRISIAVCLLAMAALIPSPPARGEQGQGEILTSADNGSSNQKPRVSVHPLLIFSNQALIPGGGSMLVRSRDGVYMSLNSAGLTPGTAVTAWWVFFNNPKKCATSPCSVADLSNADVQPSLVNATGRIVGADGTADFGAFKAVGDTTGAFTGTGLLNAMKAEIHLVVRSHGPAIVDDDAQLAQQLSQFNGGCPPNTCANLQVSIHQP
ncbi:MAG TPA: hypothetical protein VFQ92_02145 [Blastocatellia bacterium]|nr:hypothetical protein [Blastocatellia bacterium]